MRSTLATGWGILWALPYTLAGLAAGAAGLASGGRMRYRDGAVEFYGGAAAWLVRHTPLGASTLAVTLGHVILGQSAWALDITRLHERVHVRQFMMWGPLMGPAYLASSAWMWAVGRCPYRDNYFERQAFAAEGGFPQDARCPPPDAR
jgi:hypothetical protein